jgi:hypothetical protein
MVEQLRAHSAHYATAVVNRARWRQDDLPSDAGRVEDLASKKDRRIAASAHSGTAAKLLS